MWTLLGFTASKVSIGAMGCGDARDVLAAKSPIRTQLSVSFPRTIPAIKAPARLETKGRMRVFCLSVSPSFCDSVKECQ